MKRGFIFYVLCFVLLFTIVFTNASPVSAYPAYHFLNVPVVTQPKTNWCWAACGACVVQYVKNSTTTTPYHFSYAVQHNYANVTKSLEEIPDGLEFYNISSSIYQNTTTISNGSLTVNALSYSSVANYIYANRPLICGRVQYAILNGELHEGTGHVVVVEGYFNDDGVNTLSIMDPAQSTMQTMAYSVFKKSSTYYMYYWKESICNIH